MYRIKLNEIDPNEPALDTEATGELKASTEIMEEEESKVNKETEKEKVNKKLIMPNEEIK